MILLWLVLLPFRLALGTTRVGFKAGYRAGRVLGWRRLFVFGAGVAVGLAVAPTPGRELRAALRRRLEARGVTDAELDQRVRFELAHHPRTWHLPQPEVAVAARRVTLRGQVPDDEARHEMVRAASALPGVAAVDDDLQVTGTALAG
jgi:BON domain